MIANVNVFTADLLAFNIIENAALTHAFHATAATGQRGGD
jgi:hypothetical protein